MQEFIITTPDQLRTVISETVKDELKRHLQAQSTAEPQKDRKSYLLTSKQAIDLILRIIYFLAVHN
jgi:hypothetical protein